MSQRPIVILYIYIFFIHVHASDVLVPHRHRAKLSVAEIHFICNQPTRSGAITNAEIYKLGPCISLRARKNIFYRPRLWPKVGQFYLLERSSFSSLRSVNLIFICFLFTCHPRSAQRPTWHLICTWRIRPVDGCLIFI